MFQVMPPRRGQQEAVAAAQKAEAGYVTIGHTAPIPVDKTTYPNGATLRVTGADDVVGNSSPYTDSAWVLYTTGGTTLVLPAILKPV